MRFPFGLRTATRPKGLENGTKPPVCEIDDFAFDFDGDFGKSLG